MLLGGDGHGVKMFQRGDVTSRGTDGEAASLCRKRGNKLIEASEPTDSLSPLPGRSSKLDMTPS